VDVVRVGGSRVVKGDLAAAADRPARLGVCLSRRGVVLNGHGAAPSGGPGGPGARGRPTAGARTCDADGRMPGRPAAEMLSTVVGPSERGPSRPAGGAR